MIQVTTLDKKTNKMVMIGEIYGVTFYKQVQPKHFMNIVGGYGIQYDVFADLPNHKVTDIRIKEESGDVWFSTYQDWLDHGKVADYGHGKQMFLSTKYMRLDKPHKIK